MMQIDKSQPELNDVLDTVEDVFKRFGIKARRADEIEHDDVITSRILEEIASCEFLFADLSGERPSVYYEVGYAHALKKRVILYRKKATRIHFDLAHRNCPECESLRELRQLLTKRLTAMTGKQVADAE
jgi:nucleoside 2-deoxyribosyltransferase